MSKRLRNVSLTTVILVTVLFLPACLGFPVPGLDLLFFLAVGWVLFLKRVVPQLSVRWDLVVSAAVYALALLAGGHLFLRWLYRESNRTPEGAPPPRRWKFRWTLGGLLLVLAMFAAGTAAVGVVHQIAWLARSPEPMFHSRGAAANRIKCASNLKQIGIAIIMYANDHGGRYPDSLAEVLLTQDITPEVFVCPASQADRAPGATVEEQAAHLSDPRHCSYVYFGKRLTTDAPADKVIAVERLENHDGTGLNALYADGHVDWLDRPAAEKLLTELGFERVETGPR